MIRGYARVSTRDQSLTLQTDALKRYGCDHIYTDVISGIAKSRPGLRELESSLLPGDTVVVWKLDRLGRSMLHLATFFESIKFRKINFVSLQDCIDLTSATGELQAKILGAIAEFERSLIIERTRAGLESAKIRGARLGRPCATTEAQDRMIFDLREIGCSVADIALTLNTSIRTIYRRLATLSHAEGFHEFSYTAKAS